MLSPLVLILAILSTAELSRQAGSDDPSGSAWPDNKLTDKGEVAIDHQTGHHLPEEMNDGELEGGDYHIEWNYKNQEAWAKEYKACSGPMNRQSPINIGTSEVKLRPEMRLELIDYDQQVEFELKNTHHSVSLAPIASVSVPSLRLNWIPDGGLYELQEIHFHWGDCVTQGSEHKVDDRKFAAEMHMVHYKKGLNKTDIGSVPNSVAVIGVFIEPDLFEETKSIDSLVGFTSNVNGTDQVFISDNPERLVDLLPENHHRFFTYNGSLTTPPCYEVVTWILMNDPVYMKNERLAQLANFEKETPYGRQRVEGNRRDVQPLGDRHVFASYNVVDEHSVDPSIKDSRKFRKAFESYWSKVRQLPGSVRSAFNKILQAREKLHRDIAREKARAAISHPRQGA